jgi:hypothetical protein
VVGPLVEANANMRAPRFSIAGFMALIALFGVTFAALTAVTEFTAGAMMTLALAASGYALLGRLTARGIDKVAWTGYLVFGTGYLVMCVAPTCDEHVMPHLVTTLLIDEQYSKMEYAPRQAGERVWTADRSGRNFLGGEVFGSVGPNTARFDVDLDNGTTSRFNSTQLRPISPSGCRRLGHSVVSIWLGLFGMFLARYRFADRQDRSISGRESSPAPPT